VDELFLVDVAVTILVEDFKEPLAEDTW
jgi:hypothetical protein